MKEKILIFHPDINRHAASSDYTRHMYAICEKEYKVKSFEWFSLHLYARDIAVMYLNWYENPIGKNENLFIQKIIYKIKFTILRIAKAKGIKIVSVVHNKAPHDIKLDSEMYKSVYFPFMCRYLEIADNIVIVSESSRAYIKEKFNLSNADIIRKVKYVPIGIGNCNRSNKKEIREKLGLNEDDIVFGYAGRINQYKNIDVIIKAFKISNLKKLKILLIGPCDKDYENIILEQINANKNIIFINTSLDEKQISEVIQSLDAVVLPYENSSMNSGSIIYAFSNGTTVIGTKIETLKDYPSDLVYGYEYSNLDENIYNLSKAMTQAFYDCKNGELRKKGLELQNIVRSKNSWERVDEELRIIISMQEDQ